MTQSEDQTNETALDAVDAVDAVDAIIRNASMAEATDQQDAEWCRGCLRAALDEIKRLRKALQWVADNSDDPIVARHALISSSLRS